MDPNVTYALQTLAAWARQHGIHQIREVLDDLARLSKLANSSEELAAGLMALAEASVVAQELEAKPATTGGSSAVAPEPEPAGATEPEPAAPRKRR